MSLTPFLLSVDDLWLNQAWFQTPSIFYASSFKKIQIKDESSMLGDKTI